MLPTLAAIAKQERVRLSEPTMAGLERARAKNRIGGRPRKNYEHDKDAQCGRRREDGQSLEEIADELGRSKSNIVRMCQILGCSPAKQPFVRSGETVTAITSRGGTAFALQADLASAEDIERFFLGRDE